MSGGMGCTPYLPAPTGACPVGTTSLYLKDVSRFDPWAAGVNARELMVSLWYPATPSDGQRAWYMTPAESELQLTSRAITRAYVRAFFDQHLRDRPQALLDQPSPRYPEVTFCAPEAR
jgi:hypothetical protein